MGKTEINFYTGFDPACPVPEAAVSAGFEHRLAVVQETHRPDSVDMYFDQALWSALLTFAATFKPGVRVGVVDRRSPTRIKRKEPADGDETPMAI